MYGKSNMKTYITICKIGSQWEFAVWLKKLKQGLCMEREMGGRFKREGIYVYLWLIQGFPERKISYQGPHFGLATQI